MFAIFISFLLSSCSPAPHDPNHLAIVIESNPANLEDPILPNAKSVRPSPTPPIANPSSNISCATNPASPSASSLRTTGPTASRFHLTIKVSTEEQARLLGAALQDQRKKSVSISKSALSNSPQSLPISKGNFQLSYLKWVGTNNDPDFFELVFSRKRIPPNGSNRGRYRNPKVDELTDAIRVELNQQKRQELTSPVQKIAAEDLPYCPTSPSGTPT